MEITEKYHEISSRRPLGSKLDPFRGKCRPDETDDTREHVANLLGALVASPAAFSLPSPEGDGNLAVRLFSVQQNVRGGLVNLSYFRSLIRDVADDKTDIDVWTSVFTIIENIGAITPPASSIAPTFQGTPVKTSTSRLADSETRDVVERELFFEIKDCTFRNVEGFVDRFFQPRELEHQSENNAEGNLDGARRNEMG